MATKYRLVYVEAEYRPYQIQRKAWWTFGWQTSIEWTFRNEEDARVKLEILTGMRSAGRVVETEEHLRSVVRERRLEDALRDRWR